MKSAWTEQDIETLRSMFDTGANDVEVGAALRRTAAAVRDRIEGRP